MEKIHPAIFSNRKNPQKDKLQLSVDSEETVMKSEEIVRLKIPWNKCSYITTYTDMLKRTKKSHKYHSTQKKFNGTSCDY